MSKKFLHLATDEKFIDSALVLFNEVEPGQNDFFVGVLDAAKPLVFIKRISEVNCFPRNEAFLALLVEKCSSYSAVILHSLDDFAVSLVNRAPKSTRFLWLAWGYDIYNAYPHLSAELLQQHTKRICNKDPREHIGAVAIDKVKRILFGILHKYGLPHSRSLRERRKAVKRIDLCGTVLPNEWPTVRGLGFEGDFVRFNYGWLETFLPDDKLIGERLGDNILVGNSSTPSCNHVDLFIDLSRLNLAGRKLIVPLGYGDAAYRVKVIQHGREILGSAFMPLESFSDLGEYTRLLLSCGSVVMGHYRQQAMGTVVASLYMGAKVFLNESNPVYSFFRSLGVRVFSLQSEFDVIGRSASPLADVTVCNNRERLRGEYSKGTSLERTRVIVQRLGGTV